MDETLTRLIGEAFNAEREDLDLRLKLMDLDDWDSMAHMQFIVALEEQFGFELDGDEIAGMETIGDVQNMILSKTRPRG